LATTNNGTTASETFGTTSPVTGSAPTLATDGQPIADLDAITLVIDAGTGVTLSGAGSLLAYMYDPTVAVWARASDYDITVTATTRAQAFASFDVIAGRGARLKFIPSAVTFSAGSAGVLVYQLGHSKSLKGRY
jgi:hypothetical protein